jgi:phospholipid/cholesterol/gamma-HCH transport system permease protein
MFTPSSGITGYARDRTRPALEAVGGFARMRVLTAKALFRWPFQWREFILQSWFLIRVAFVPTIMVSIPLTVLLIFTLNILRGVVPYPATPRRTAPPSARTATGQRVHQQVN